MKVNELFSIKFPYFFPDEIPDVPLGDETNEDEEDTTTEDEGEGREEEGTEEEGEGKKGKEDEAIVLTRVEYSEVKEKYPALFKDFPQLKEAFFREQNFTELFPSIEDAQRALEAETAYNEITEAVVSGDAKTFITQLEQESKEGLEKFSTNFLETLRETNKELYFDVVGPTLKTFIKNVYDYGRGRTDEKERTALMNAAKVVRQALFGGKYEDIESDTDTTSMRDRSKKDDSVDKDKEAYYAGKYQELYKDVTNVCYSKLDEEINKGLDDLSKTKPGLKKILAKTVRDSVLQEMNKDENYIRRMNGLWSREKRNGFSGTLKNSFVTTFLGKAKTLVPKLRSEARREALGKEDSNNNNREPTRLTGGREARGGKIMTPERAKKEGLTTRQIFD